MTGTITKQNMYLEPKKTSGWQNVLYIRWTYKGWQYKEVYVYTVSTIANSTWYNIQGRHTRHTAQCAHTVHPKHTVLYNRG
jgi:hypothetical protein